MTACLSTLCAVLQAGSCDARFVEAVRRDVRLLGDLLGRVLVEQEDESLLADVEHVRALSRAARQGERRDELREAVESLPLARQASVLRAFALYFQVANVAEQHNRIRRRRAYAREDRARALLVQRYRGDVRALAAEIGVSSRLTSVSGELLESIARDERE